MPPIQRSLITVLGVVAVLSLLLGAPLATYAQEEPVAVAEADPVAAAPAVPSWDETSGYGAVEATRAAISGSTWDESSGYGAVETTRALNALPDEPSVITSLVSSDVRWAPERAIAPALSAEASRVAAAQHALLSTELGSLQEEALMAIVAASTSWDDRSGYGSIEATRAAISSVNEPTIADEAALRAQFRAVELAMSSSLGTESDAAPLARGTRAESGILWSIIQDDAMPATSDDRIAEAPFGTD